MPLHHGQTINVDDVRNPVLSFFPYELISRIAARKIEKLITDY